jgi:hypothetical protein
LALDEMQDRLGSLNDVAVHENLTADFATDTASKAQAKDRSRRAFAAGVLMGLEDARLNSVSAAAVAVCERLRRQSHSGNRPVIRQGAELQAEPERIDWG